MIIWERVGAGKVFFFFFPGQDIFECCVSPACQSTVLLENKKYTIARKFRINKSPTSSARADASFPVSVTFTKHLRISVQCSLNAGTRPSAPRFSLNYIWTLNLNPTMKPNFSVVSQHPTFPRVIAPAAGTQVSGAGSALRNSQTPGMSPTLSVPQLFSLVKGGWYWINRYMESSFYNIM